MASNTAGLEQSLKALSINASKNLKKMNDTFDNGMNQENGEKHSVDTRCKENDFPTYARNGGVKVVRDNSNEKFHNNKGNNRSLNGMEKIGNQQEGTAAKRKQGNGNNRRKQGNQNNRKKPSNQNNKNQQGNIKNHQGTQNNKNQQGNIKNQQGNQNNKNQQGNNNNNKNKNKKKNRLRKPKNTTDFTRRFDKPDLRMVYGSPKQDKAPELTVHDVMFVPELFCQQDNYSLYESLLTELNEATKSNDKDLFALWHGDSHVIANDKIQQGAWKKASPSFQSIIAKMESYFEMDIAATRLNWYRPGTNDWKPFHFDRAAFTPGCPQNLTVAATLGPTTREVGFQHAKKNTKVFFQVPNGSAYSFSRDVNCEWKHGVIPLESEEEHAADKGRISIIAWGLAKQSTKGSRITENDVPSAKDLGLER